MASQELQKVLGLLAERPLGAGNPTLEEMRAGMEASSFPVTEAATVTPVEANGVPGEWVTVPESDPNRRLLYVHGGGYVIGSPVTHRRLCEEVARAAGCSVLNLDYRLAPEHPFPAAVEDAIEGLKFIQSNGPDGEGAATPHSSPATRPAADSPWRRCSRLASRASISPTRRSGSPPGPTSRLRARRFRPAPKPTR